MLHPSSSRTDEGVSWLMTLGVKNCKHVFVFFQQTQNQNFLEHNPYILDTFDLDGDDQQNCLLAACSMGPVTTPIWIMKATSNCVSSMI